MPRLNRHAQAVMGVGSGPASIDGQVIAPVGGCASWLDDNHVIYSTGHAIEVLDVRNGRVTQAAAEGANELAAGGGRWLAFSGVSGLFGALTLPPGGVSLTITDGRGAIGRDGTLAYIPVRRDGLPTILRAPDGSETAITDPAGAYGLQVLGPGQAIWMGGRSIGIVPPRLRRPEGRVVLAVVGGARWAVYWSAGVGLVAHPSADDSQVVVLERRPIAFYHDAVGLADALHVAWSTGQGEHPHELVKMAVSEADLVAWPADGHPAPQPTPVPNPTPEPRPEDPVSFDDSAQIALISRIAREVDAEKPGLRSRDLEAYQRLVAWRCYQRDKRIGRKSNHGTSVAISRAALGIRYDLDADTSGRVRMTAVDYVRDETSLPNGPWKYGTQNGIRPQPEIHRNELQYWIAPAPAEGGDQDDPGDSQPKPGPGPVMDPRLLPIAQELTVVAVRLDESIAALRAIPPAPTPEPHVCPTPRWPDDHECPTAGTTLAEPDAQAARRGWERIWRGPLPGDLLTFLLFRLLVEGASSEDLDAEVGRRRG